MLNIRRIVHKFKSVPGVTVLANLPGIRVLKDEIGSFIDTYEIKRQPDRVFFLETILPNVAKLQPRSLLFVGCRRYSMAYCAYWTAFGIDCWTIDIDPEAARWGSPRRHVVGNILEVDTTFPADRFDAVIMNGVFGFGVETVDQIDHALHAVSKVLKTGGLLVVGWNTDRTIDPAGLASMGEHFCYSERLFFPKRKTFPSSTHTYDFYVKFN